MEWIGEVSESHVHVSRQKFPPVESYLNEMTSLGISKAILSQNIGNGDNEYLIESVRKFPDKFRAIAMFDYQDEQTPSLINSLKDVPEIIGARLFADSGEGSGNPLAIWEAIRENNWIASVRGPIAKLDAPFFRGILQEFSDVKIRIEHLGSFKFTEDRSSEFDVILELSEFSNLYIMWGGFYANSSRQFPYLDAAPYLKSSLRAYGAERVMWTGDWNANIPQGDSQGCRDSIRLFSERRILPEMSDEEIDFLMGRTLFNYLGWGGSPRSD
jgi:L-fuconolactonase